MKIIYFAVLIVGALAEDSNETSDKASKKGKLLPVFQVVRFPNDVCVVTGGSRNGTCYTAEECSNKGGTNAGDCASGFGVCCTFTLGCGSSISENLTYFDSASTVLTGACRAKICKINSNICQIRLDFDTFVISGPSTNTLSVGKTLNGDFATGAGVAVGEVTRCLTDTFSVSNQNTMPVLCGTNSGYHAYFEASDNCNDLDFQLGNVARGITTVATRSWSIKVSQYSCDYENLAPIGCTQYFYGSGATNLIYSYNYAGGKHLADQKQVVCVRRESGNCKICWTATALTDIAVNGDANIAKNMIKGSLCCAYGTKGDGDTGYDCLMIPGARKATSKSSALVESHCGRAMGLQTKSTSKATTHATICSKTYPFRIVFYSDSFEDSSAANKESTGSGTGFKLRYFQTSC